MSNLFLPATVTVRRYLAFFLALLLAATVFAIASAAPARAAAEYEIDGILYTVDTDNPDAGATVTGYTPEVAARDAEVPDTVLINRIDYPVTAIGDSAFVSLHGGKYFTSVTLPDSIVTIGDWAFVNNLLTAVTLPEGLTTIGRSAFSDNLLASVAVPESLTALGDSAFNNNRLTSVVIPSGLTTIGNHTFARNRLTSVVIPAGVTAVGEGAFSYNENLSQVHFTGPAPTTITGADTGSDYLLPSLGTATGLTVTFPAQYLAESQQQGYSAPKWLGYDAHPSSYRVSFDSGDGSAVDPVSVAHGGLLDLPPVPVREGYTFTGWNTAPELDMPFDSSLPITQSLTLFAGWQQNSYTVSFDTGGGAVVAPATVAHGAVLELPSAPVREGYAFTGWYTTAERDVSFNAVLPITENQTLFAGWQRNSVPAEPVIPGWVSSVSGSLGSLALASPLA